MFFVVLYFFLILKRKKSKRPIREFVAHLSLTGAPILEDRVGSFAAVVVSFPRVAIRKGSYLMRVSNNLCSVISAFAAKS